MSTRKCLSLATADGHPCQNEVSIERTRCEAGHLCTTPALSLSETSREILLAASLEVDELDVAPRGALATTLMSTSAASDGGFVAIVDVAMAARRAGLGDQYRLIGGIAVMLQVQRLELDVPLRETADADYGVPPMVLLNGALVAELEGMGYARYGASNRWARRLDDRRTASIDLLVPAYTSRPRPNRRVGAVATTEVPGLAVALLRQPVPLHARFRLTDGSVIEERVLLPDPVSMLALKAGARLVRDESRDAEDLWRCLEVAAAEGVGPEDLPETALREPLPDLLGHDLGRGGPAMAILRAGLSLEAAGRRETRIQALLRRVAGI